MFTHYLKISLRNLLKNKAQSVISIIGLTVGFICITLSAIWVRYEMTYDTSHPAAKDIYRIIAVNPEDASEYDGIMPSLLAGHLQQELPEIEAATTIRTWTADVLFYNNASIDKCYNADAGFFNVFSPQFILGNKETAFNSQYSVILTENTANKLFGSPEKAMGSTLPAKDYWSGEITSHYTVAGIIKDFKHSNLKFNAILKFTPTSDEAQWGNNSFKTYIRLKNNINKKNFDDKLKNLVIKEAGAKLLGLTAAPISQMQYKYPFPYEQTQALPFIYIVILSAVSLLLFVCALFNHLALFISLLFMRFKDIGLRKSMGAKTVQLFIMLITEFLFTLLLAFVLSACIIELIRPNIIQIMNIDFGASGIFGNFIIVAATGIILSFFIACYPIWRVCGTAIKTSITGKNFGKRQYMQRILIAMQLIISIFFFILTSVMYYQLHFMKNKDLGFNRKNVIQIENNRDYMNEFHANAELIYNELKEIPTIQDILKQGMPFFAENGVTSTTGINWDGKDENSRIEVASMRLDYNFTDFFDVKIREGRFFDKDRATDNDKMLVNEKLANIIGNPVGKLIQFQGKEREVIGIIPDINDRSLKYEPLPAAITLSTAIRTFYIRVLPENKETLLEQVDKIFRKHGIVGFTSETMDDYFDNFTKAENTMMTFIGLISIVCLIISSFGIYSLTLFSMQRRKREVAIRKVMGASVGDIIRMFFKEYLWLVLIAGLIAIPPAYYIMEKWLQSYANRISIEWWLIALIIIVIAIIVVVTVLRQIIKAANSNPAEVIKYE